MTSVRSGSDRSIRLSVMAPVAQLIDKRGLIYSLSRQKIVSRYRGSIIGPAWALLAPAMHLAIYTLVFGVIFKPRWATESTETTEYALLLYLGLCVFWFLSECISEAPGLIREHSNFVKKVVFPLEVLVWESVARAVFHLCLRLVVYLVAYCVIEGWPPVTACLLPIVLVPLVFFTAGLSWLLSAIGVFARDVGEFVSLALTALLFLSPVFYALESVPEAFRFLMQLNPLTEPVGELRDIAYFGRWLDPRSWLVSLGASYAVAWVGYAFFRRIRGGFADVL